MCSADSHPFGVEEGFWKPSDLNDAEVRSMLRSLSIEWREGVPLLYLHVANRAL